MLTKEWKKNRPRGVEYDVESIQLWLIENTTPPDKVYEHDVLMFNWYAYIAIYDEQMLSFIAYPLWGHSIPKKHITDELEIFVNIFDFYIEYDQFRKTLPLRWPYKTFSKNLEFYLNNAGYSLYR